MANIMLLNTRGDIVDFRIIGKGNDYTQIDVDTAIESMFPKWEKGFKFVVWADGPRKEEH